LNDDYASSVYPCFQICIIRYIPRNFSGISFPLRQHYHQVIIFR
jgi:hypothetical protein